MAKVTTRSGEMNVYTVLLVVSAITLLVGVGVLLTANLQQANAAGAESSPFTVIK